VEQGTKSTISCAQPHLTCASPAALASCPATCGVQSCMPGASVVVRSSADILNWQYQPCRWQWPSLSQISSRQDLHRTMHPQYSYLLIQNESQCGGLLLDHIFWPAETKFCRLKSSHKPEGKGPLKKICCSVCNQHVVILSSASASQLRLGFQCKNHRNSTQSFSFRK